MEFLKGLFSESSGASAMRIMSMMSLIIGGVIAMYGIYVGKDLAGLAALCAVFVGAAFGGKVGQKFAEIKSIGEDKEGK